MLTRDGALVILAFGVAVGCANGDLAWPGTMVDSAGVTIVANPGAGLWAPGEEWRLYEDLRIGAAEGDPHYEFGSIGGITVDSRGRIYVLDGQAQHIRVYSADGVFERILGGPGDGPGELRAGMTLLMGPGDTLLVPDGRNLRINRYPPDGMSPGSFRMALEHGRSMAFRASPSGLIAEQLRPLSVLLPDQPVTPDSLDVLVLRATDGAVTDTLLRFRSGELLVPGAGAVGFTLFAAEPVWDLADDRRLIFGGAVEYRFHVYEGRRLRRIIDKPYERRPVSEDDIAAVMREMERRWDEAGAPPELRERVSGRIHFADFFPPYQNVAFGPEGTIWVQRVKPPSEMSPAEIQIYHERPSPDWDVFDPEGRFLGAVTMPARFQPSVFRGDKVYGAWRDDADVSYAVRFRIAGDSASS